MSTSLFLSGDIVWLTLLELVIVVVFLLAVFKDRAAKARVSSPRASVKRGEKSWFILLSFWALSIIIIQIILSSEVIASHKVIVGLINVAILVYLNLFSSSFRNRIIGWSIKLRNSEENV